MHELFIVALNPILSRTIYKYIILKLFQNKNFQISQKSVINVLKITPIMSRYVNTIVNIKKRS